VGEMTFAHYLASQPLDFTKKSPEDASCYDGRVRKLLAWCASRGIRVELADGSYFYPGSRRIELNWRVSKEVRMFHLLHECGHYLVSKSGRRHEAANGAEFTLETRIAILEEELEAWYRGRRLAARLGIKINRKRWASVRRKCLASYVLWTIDGGKKP